MSKLQVCVKPCSQCLFSRSRIVSAERKAEVLTECRSSDSHFVCHKTESAVCAGFYKRFDTNLIRVMGRLGGLEFIEGDQKP
ncbi:MAG: hypothetical protein KME42_13835 [Tildeniella nuda ZEHNDER 1965/U140]|jgi:hypothetical protein|nr:hypothetical protein [Tildeniella nuda ZEHNDER 1965/U140]